MKDMGLIMREAHKMAKEIKNEYPEVDYKFQLGLCISYLLNERVEEKMELKELKGTEKLERVLEILKENNKYISKASIKNDYTVITISKELVNKKEEIEILKDNRDIVKYIVHLTYLAASLDKKRLNNLEKTLDSLNPEIASKEEGLYMLFLDSLDIYSNLSLNNCLNLNWFKNREEFEYCLRLAKTNCDKYDYLKYLDKFLCR